MSWGWRPVASPGKLRRVSEDPYDLQRFVTAQDSDGTYERALVELRTGRKLTHWMWFVLPQLEGLGRTTTAQHYAVSGIDEAKAYLAHPVLGPRLVATARALLEIDADDPAALLGQTDAMKLRSSMTLFTVADPGQTEFAAVLARYFDGRPDEVTESRL